MTLSEFKAWFEGFTEDMDGAPSEKQFGRIKAKVEEIDDEPIEKNTFIYRYGNIFPQPFWDRPYVSYSVGAVQTGDAVGRVVLSVHNGEMSMSAARTDVGWDGLSAMRELGRAEVAL